MECEMKWTILGIGLLLVAAAVPVIAAVEEGGDWVAKIRKDHPRLFFNADTWEGVRQRALTVNRAELEGVKKHADGPAPGPYWPDVKLPDPRPGSEAKTADWGVRLMSAAFVYRVEPTPERLQKIREKLWASLDYYHASYAASKCVNWYSTSRVGWIAAYDWVWNDLTADDRTEMGRSMLKHVDEVLHKPNILRRNGGDYRTGYYGGRNASWFIGLATLSEGIDDAKALELLKEGHGMFQKLLAHRAKAAGDDGGAASPTLGYSLAAYPWAEWNFLYTWRSATGEDLSGKWTYIGMFPNYVLWNWLPGGLEYGYGDTPHTTNKIPGGWLYTHMSHAMHLYAESHPDLAALAARMREQVGGGYISGTYSVYPFLMTSLEKCPPAKEVGALPPARHFENMGQVFMRSGDGPDDTYAMFACGGILDQHRHYDANHFVIYRRGHLALDTGTREGNTDNLQNYYAQTVAHNCVLIKMPGEPPSPYWNGTVYGQDGGQYKPLGSKVIAFETGPRFTYVAGDATATYRPEKCSRAIRQLIFLPPDHFVVFDRVTATKPEYAKRWLLHHANEPVVEGATWRSDQGRGRIFCRTLLPTDAVLEKVGGPGKEFLADGVNYSITTGVSAGVKDSLPNTATLTYKEVPELMGRWRMEVKPGSARTDDVFLHLIQVGDQSPEAMCEARVQAGDGGVEVSFAAGEKSVRLGLSSTGGVGGHLVITRGDETLVDRELTREVVPQEGLASVRS